METREIGTTGIRVGAIGLGCMGMSHGYDHHDFDDERSTAVLREAPSLGVTLIDTAPIYGYHHNERLVGTALDGRRDQVVLATKCGLYPGEGNVAGDMVRDARPESVRQSCDESLERLRTDVIDLFQLHRVDPAVPIEETWGAMAGLKAAGKVRAIGLSEATLEEVVRAHAVAPVDAVQSEMSLWTRQWFEDVFAWTLDNDVAFLPYAPLGRGFLTGTLAPGREFGDADIRSRNPRFQAHALAANQALVDEVRVVADAHGATPGQVALAWLLAQGPRVIPIPGTKRPEYLRENASAADLVLSGDELARLTALPAPVGGRY